MLGCSAEPGRLAVEMSKKNNQNDNNKLKKKKTWKFSDMLLFVHDLQMYSIQEYGKDSGGILLGERSALTTNL